MRLRWVFTVQPAVILLKNMFEFMFNNVDQPYTGRAGGSSREKAFNNIISTFPQCVPRGVVVICKA